MISGVLLSRGKLKWRCFLNNADLNWWYYDNHEGPEYKSPRVRYKREFHHGTIKINLGKRNDGRQSLGTQKYTESKLFLTLGTKEEFLTMSALTEEKNEVFCNRRNTTSSRFKTARSKVYYRPISFLMFIFVSNRNLYPCKVNCHEKISPHT